MEKCGILWGCRGVSIADKSIRYHKLFPSDMWPKQVGNRYLPSKKILSYRDIYEDGDIKKSFSKWVDPSLFLPFVCDLVLLKFHNKEHPGWWDGYKWIGLRIESSIQPIAWKRIAQVHDVIDYRMERSRQREKLQKRFANLKH